MTITRDAGSEKGVSWVASSESSIHNVLNTSSCLLHAPLQASLLLSRGTGSPTFTRATKSWGFNELGYLKELSSGCAFFGGARLVRNLFSKSELFSAATWSTSAATKTDNGNGSYTVTGTGGTYSLGINEHVAIVGATMCATVRFSKGNHRYVGIRVGQYITADKIPFYDFDTDTVSNIIPGATLSRTIVSPGVVDLTILAPGVTVSTVQIWGTASDGNVSTSKAAGQTFIIWRAQLVDVTGYNASYVPEYVSVGVSRNEIINTEDPSNASWTMIGGIGTKTAVITDGPDGNQINVCRVTVGVSTTGLRIQGSGTVTSGAKISGAIWVRKISGSGTQITLDLNDAGSAVFDTTAVWQKIQLADISHASASVKFIDITISTATWTTGDIIEVCYPQYNYGSTLNDYTVVGGSYVYDGAGIDGAKYFETDWQGAPIPAANLLGFRREASATNNLLHSRDLSNAAWSTKTNITAAKTATGLDGIANTATTLTATAADAIILQPITLASAARCASAYVKRRTGTGTISFTQDGGSSWTDITSQINSSTWSRVQITSTLANPSVGFKLGTSGDAIDVDCVQNEAGSVATSPIVTTTATVTRNSDSLTYQTASNWSDTAGTAFVEVAPLAYSGGAIGSATNGLLLSTSNSGATAYDGTNSANGPSGTPGSSEKLAFRWGGSAMTVSSGGVIGTPGTYDGGMGLSSIEVGSSAAGFFKNAAIYNYAMTDAELRAVTA